MLPILFSFSPHNILANFYAVEKPPVVNLPRCLIVELAYGSIPPPVNVEFLRRTGGKANADEVATQTTMRSCRFILLQYIKNLGFVCDIIVFAFSASGIRTRTPSARCALRGPSSRRVVLREERCMSRHGFRNSSSPCLSHRSLSLGSEVE